MQGLIVASRGFSTSIVDTGLTSLEQVDATPETGEKRGRGRPRKYPATSTPKPASDAPKRGRGRPRKIVSEPAPAVVTPSGPKRGRGRPRKDSGMQNILTCCGWYMLTLVPCYQAMRHPSPRRSRRRMAVEDPARTLFQMEKPKLLSRRSHLWSTSSLKLAALSG